MKNFVIRFYFLMLMSNNVLTIMMEPNSNNDNQRKASHVVQFDDPSSFNEALQSCLAERNYGTIECFNRGALTTLQSWNDNDCLDFGNIKLERSDAESRNFLNFEEDSSNIVNLIKATSKLLESRNIKWDLGNIYPGLQMRVGPTLSASNGLLEFVMDERRNHYVNNRQIGTGKLLMRQLLLPFLLGFKLNLTTLLPLLFGALIIITKKALLLTKVALFIAGLIGWNSLFNRYPSSSNYQPDGF
ncbi:PREDICTED: uncharacterized protein LOC105368406 [Ceratosolen solmsi marchali]|uniref:Uncharacterized protein LOC105368406 n=1 Tax=Ceratosolen solmsi marchali TaxID=326594 RepID=A0AAJ6YWN2_9HYME|nr:PREDICTED: uncharacterized protein LOC105368406 [Ceratosolen solmsi marchali]